MCGSNRQLKIPRLFDVHDKELLPGIVIFKGNASGFFPGLAVGTYRYIDVLWLTLIITLPAR